MTGRRARSERTRFRTSRPSTTRQAKIEQRDVVGLVADRLNGKIAVSDPVDGIGSVLQRLQDGRANHFVVFDQQHSRATVGTRDRAARLSRRLFKDDQTMTTST